MFLIGAGTLVSLGEFSRLLIETAEFYSVLWLPFLLLGILLCIIGLSKYIKLLTDHDLITYSAALYLNLSGLRLIISNTGLT